MTVLNAWMIGALRLVHSPYIRYGARVRKPTVPEQLYMDFDGFFAACEEQADRRLQGRPLGVIPVAGAVWSYVIAANTRHCQVNTRPGTIPDDNSSIPLPAASLSA